MAGGRGTRLKTPVEKPLFRLHDKPLIKYVLDNLNSSKLVEKIIIATSPNTPKTSDYIKNFNHEIVKLCYNVNQIPVFCSALSLLIFS